MAGPAEATALGNIAMQMVGIGAVGSIDDARDLIARSFPFDVYEPAGQGPWDSTYGAFKALVER
jgi:sugar (pentulose or hexulose) kinase